MKVASEAIEEGGYKGDFSPAVSLYVAPVTCHFGFCTHWAPTSLRRRGASSYHPATRARFSTRGRVPRPGPGFGLLSLAVAAAAAACLRRRAYLQWP